MNWRIGDSSGKTSAGEAEATLRILASLPAPQGLEKRVQAALKNAPAAAHVLPWPSGVPSSRSWSASSVARGAAAAAIVFVVAGGGWGVYSRVQPAPSPKVIAMPRVVDHGFSSANAIRTPQTLTGPVLTHAVTASPKKTDPSVAGQKQDAKKKVRPKKEGNPLP